MYNILKEPSITVQLTEGGEKTVCLPELFVLLHEDKVAVFPRLLAHQRHPWHALLVQLVCLALWDEPETDEPTNRTAAAWAKALRRLTSAFPDDEPWQMVTPHGKPAFLQPPVLDGPVDKWGTVPTPDDLDVLISSKNHGVKQEAMNRPLPEDWLYALISVQTHGPYKGRGHFGIARQNGGYGTRPGFSLVTSPNPGAQWRREVRIILQNKEDFPLLFTNPRHALLWLEPWDGKTSWPLHELHPLFIEICRRIRLENTDDQIRARNTPTTSSRLEAKDQQGKVGDPWIPIHAKENKSFALKPNYANLSLVLGNGVYSRPLLMQHHPGDPQTGMALQCRIFVRGMGTTEGYVERLIPINGSSSWSSCVEAGVLAEAMVKAAQCARFTVLKPALKVFLQGDKPAVPSNDAAEVKNWLPLFTDALDVTIDEAFFPALWAMLRSMSEGEELELALEQWNTILQNLTERQFENALQSLPDGGLKGEARARQKFASLCHVHLPVSTKSLSGQNHDDTAKEVA